MFISLARHARNDQSGDCMDSRNTKKNESAESRVESGQKPINQDKERRRGMQAAMQHGQSQKHLIHLHIASMYFQTDQERPNMP